jgi:hypothetical protein
MNLSIKNNLQGFWKHKLLLREEKESACVLMIVRIEMDFLFSLVKVSINEIGMVWSISNFISRIITSGVSSLTSILHVVASTE